MFRGRMYKLDRFEDDLAVLLEFPSESNVLVVPKDDLSQDMKVGDVLLVDIEEEGFKISKVNKSAANFQNMEKSLMPSQKINSYYIDYEQGCLVYTTASWIAFKGTAASVSDIYRKASNYFPPTSGK